MRTLLSIQFLINLETALKDKIYLIKLGRRQGVLREDKVCISDKGDKGKQSLKARWNWSGRNGSFPALGRGGRPARRLILKQEFVPTGFAHQGRL